MIALGSKNASDSKTEGEGLVATARLVQDIWGFDDCAVEVCDRWKWKAPEFL